MRKKLLSFLKFLATKHRKTVFATSLILTLGLGAACGLVKLDMRWSELLPESMPVVKEFRKIDENFLQPGNMIIAVSGPDPVLLEQITDEAAGILREELVCEPGATAEECKMGKRYARYVYGKMPEKWLIDHALQLAKPKDVERVYNMLKDPRLLPYLVHLNDDLEAEYTDSENVKSQERQIVASLDAVQGLLENIDSATAETVSEEQVSRTIRDLTIGRPYTFSLDNSVSLIMVASAIPSDDFETLPMMDKKIEKLLAPLDERYLDYRIERTGIIAIGRDEMDSVGVYTYVITLVALVLVFLLLIWNFRSVLIPILALIPIAVGIIWTVGIIALTLGTLNIITVMIMVVLLGLGIDFSIHIANRFHEEIASRKSVEESLKLAIGRTGVGVITGAVTTAVAFLALMIADTKAIRQFGFCSGVGVLTTLLAVMLILPSLLAYRTVRQSRKINAQKRLGKAYDFRMLGSIAEYIGSKRKIVIPISIVITLVGIWAGINLKWEWNFLNLEAKGLRSVELQDEIIEKFKFSASTSMLTAESIEESRFLRRKFKEKSIIGEVDDISQWVSRPGFDESRAYIQMLHDALTEEGEQREFTESERSELKEELDRLWANIVEIQALSITGGQDRVAEKTQQIVASRSNREAGFLRQLVQRFEDEGSINWNGLDAFSQDFGKKLRKQTIQMAARMEPVTLSMVPKDILAMYTSTSLPGYLMHLYPKKNLFERDKMEMFQDTVTSVHPSVTGMPQMFLNMNLQTIQEGKIACLAAIVVIFVVLLIDFRRILLAGLAFLPLISGMSFMLGMLWLLGQKINYINMIALPVIIGIGVDDGVHFFHRYIQEGRGGLGRAVTSVGRAMLMTSLTTMIGFGSLMLYLMRGMASLGLALFLGVGGCFLFTLILLPALARLLENRIFRDESERGTNDA